MLKCDWIETRRESVANCTAVQGSGTKYQVYILEV